MIIRRAQKAYLWWCRSQWAHQQLQTAMRQCSSGISCWKCGKTIPLEQDRALFFCHCPHRTIVPSTTDNYFKVMGCKQSYEIDVTALKNTYKRLQADLHPDRFTNKTQEEKEISAEQSSLVNKAYSTLLDPYTRGLFLLELHEHTIDEKDNTVGSDLEFLEEVMLLNEELQELREDTDYSRLSTIRDISQSKLENFTKQLQLDFKGSDIEAAKGTLAKMKYFVNINTQARYLLPLEYH